MRIRPRPSRRARFPLLLAVLSLSACEVVNGPAAPARNTAPSSVGVATSSIGSKDGDRPYGAKLVWRTDSIVTASQSGDPLFGGRCSAPSRFVEFGHLSGQIMHAGLSRGTGEQCIQGTPQTGLTITDGILTFTTANGDVLIVSYAQATISLVNGLFIVDGQFSVTGGTGRFEGASGAGTQHGEANATPLEVLAGAPLQLEQTGTIRYAPGRGGQSIALSSAAATIVVGQTDTIHVTGASTGLTWSVNDIVGGDEMVGRIDQAGHYTAPSVVPEANPIRITAAQKGGSESGSISLAVSPAPVNGFWSFSQPRVITIGTTKSTILVTNAPSGTTRVDLVPSDGGPAVPLTPLGGTLFQVTIPVGRALHAYVSGDLHAFVGYLDYYSGTSRSFRGNLFQNVSDGTVPSVVVTPRSADVQYSGHVVNIRYESLFLGGGIPAAVARRFYQFFPDEYDFLGVIEQADVYANRNYQAVKNTETGFAVPVFDRTSEMGSGGRLLGMIDYPISSYFDLAEKASLHEMGHRWMVFLPSPFSIGGQSHWPLGDVSYGMMGFSLPGGQGGSFSFTMTPTGADYTLHAAPPATHYNDLELYLMGLAPASEVGPHFVFQNQDQQAALRDGGTLHGPVTTFIVGDIVSALGPRTPPFGLARTRFAFGTIVLSAGRLLSADEMAFFDLLAARGAATVPLHFTSGFSSGTTLPFNLATNGRGQLSTSIH